MEDLMRRLQHTEPEVRYAAAQQLGATGGSSPAEAVDALIAALPDDNDKVQYACVSGLVKLGDRRAADPIITQLIDHPDSRVWELLKLGIGSRLRSGLAEMVERGDEALAERLLLVISGDTLDEQQEAFMILLLGRTGSADAVEPLIDRLIQDTPTIQQAAAQALGWIGSTRAVAPLVLFVDDTTSAMREVSIEALGRIGAPETYDTLLSALADKDEWVRRAAAEALGRLGDKRAMTALVDLMQDEIEMVQDAAFDAIKLLSDEHYTTSL